ncbi:MAG TPA: hypothetical protein VJG30_00480 [Candidatus Nanoarchaeia archaeon]|nr:hypothetical protein [Candidatus Nanoarchaeia archaeon]
MINKTVDEKTTVEKKGQSALEFLLTYSWAIIIVLFALGALAYFGITNPQKFMTRSCISSDAGLSCDDFKVDSDSIYIVLRNGFGTDLNHVSVIKEGCDPDTNADGNDYWKAGEVLGNGKITMTNCNNEARGSKYTEVLKLTYTTPSGLSHEILITLNDKIEKDSENKTGNQTQNNQTQNNQTTNNTSTNLSVGGCTPISIESNYILFPRQYLDGDVVAWTDERNWQPGASPVNLDVYAYNLITRQEFPIVTNPNYQITPFRTKEVISKNIVVWSDERSNSREVYFYNIDSQQEKRISYGSYPIVSGDIIIYSSEKNGTAALYVYNIITDQEIRITKPLQVISGPLFTDYSISGKNGEPCSAYSLSECNVIWRDFRDFYNNYSGSDIYSYNLGTNSEKIITNASLNQYRPDISGNLIVWLSDVNSTIFYPPRHVYSYDLSTGQQKVVNNRTTWKTESAIDNNKIVWTEGGRQIYSYDITTNQEKFLTNVSINYVGVSSLSNDIYLWRDETRNLYYLDINC